MRYIQRYPCQPKATLWKRYNIEGSVDKRTIYVATSTIGFEAMGYPLSFVQRTLASGELATNDSVEYIYVTEEINDEIKPIKTVYLNGYYEFNPSANTMEIQDLPSEGTELISAVTSRIIKIDKNTYIRKFAFDCIKENDQQTAMYQPLQGLMTGSSYLTLKTHYFCDATVKPQCEDLIFYQGNYWMIVDVRETFIYTPREQSVMHLSVNKIVEVDNE